jgi:hypothetical protein
MCFLEVAKKGIERIEKQFFRFGQIYPSFVLNTSTTLFQNLNDFWGQSNSEITGNGFAASIKEMEK